MPATEETYRKQTALHVVFGITSIGMMLSVVWMILADHNRPWKKVQREFQRVETAKLAAAERKEQEALEARYKDELAAIDREIAEANARAVDNARLIRAKGREIESTRGRFEKLDTAKRFQKAELDSQRSFYDGMIDRDERSEANRYLAGTIVPSERKLYDLTRQYEEVAAKLAAQEKELADLRGNVEAKEKRKEDLRRDLARVQRTLEQKKAQYFGLPALVRGLPIIDLAAPPTKIQQISLPELTINYNFKDVPRYDRCTTCHMGIDRIGYDTDAEGRPMQEAHPAFAAHPHLTDGATAIDPRGKVVQAGLYLDANGPHPINAFGCTICHGGQGSGTDFTYASHEPDGPREKEEWERKYNWHEMHHWDEPMLPTRFMQSSCLKCHHQVTDIPQADKLQAGYERITKYGCTGCHTIGGEGAFGPDLTDNRQVGPNLKHLASKVSKDWALKWVKNPHHFRPDTRMPRFYDVNNNDRAEDQPKVFAEVHAITHYLFSQSKPPEGFVDPPAEADAGRGKTLFFEKGCLACHAHRDYAPETFAEEVRAVADKYAKGDFGPDLSNVAAKFPDEAAGRRWLTNWIHDPEKYHPKTLMPNLQLSVEDSADIAAWLMSVPGAWPEPVEVPAVDSPEVAKGLDELIGLYLSKAKTYKGQTILLSEVDSTVAGMSRDEKLTYLGEKTISRLGCFGCHNISGYETAKPIGTPLNGWGVKSPTKLDFGHITEFIIDQKADEEGVRDGTTPYYQEKLVEHTRPGFLFQKLHRPRSYDYKKENEDLKAWDDRLRMPQFSWADDPAAVEEVMTFVLGLTAEKIAARYLPGAQYNPAQVAVARGARLVERYNCKGCHVLEMPKYTVPDGVKLADALPDLEINVEVSYGDRKNDYLRLYPGLDYEEGETPALQPDGEGRGPVTIVGMPTASIEEEGDDGKMHRKVSVQLWEPATILGYTFNVGDKISVDPDKVRVVDAVGGNFAWLYAAAQAAETGSDYAAFWNRLPPPLLREGKKVQTPWLTSFLKDPYAIRPATQLRMPRFHYGSTLAELAEGATDADAAAAKLKAHREAQAETRDLANYFAARDGAEFPYQDIPERDRDYLSAREAEHHDYLAGGWQIVTKGLCVQCHAIGTFKPSGGENVVNGPDLRQVNGRFRPEYLAEWLANPRRLVPYTAMPQNIPPHPEPNTPTPAYVPKSFEGEQLDQVLAMRDMLLNYVTAVEQQLASAAAPASPPAEGQDKAAAPAKAGEGGGR